MPGDRRAPVVPDNQRALLAERRNERDHVADIVEDRVGGDILRRGGAAKAAHVGRNRAKPDCGERDHLVAPRIPNLRPAMAQQHHRAMAVFGDIHLDPVDRMGAEPKFKGHHNPRPGSTKSFGLVGKVCFETTTEGTSAI